MSRRPRLWAFLLLSLGTGALVLAGEPPLAPTGPVSAPGPIRDTPLQHEIHDLKSRKIDPKVPGKQSKHKEAERRGTELPPFPSGVLDVSGRTVYLAGADGAVEAVDLLTGEVLWKTHEAQVPIQVIGDRLAAQAGVKRNRIRILTLDVRRKGEVVQESDPVVFPRWVVTGEAPGHTFEGRWRVEKTQVVLNWSASAWAGGVQLSTHREPSTRKHAEGSARIDLDSGEVELGPVEKVPPPPASTLPPQLQKLAVRWHTVLDGHLLALVSQELPRTKPPAVRDGFRSTEGSGVPWKPTSPAGKEKGSASAFDRDELPPRQFALILYAWDVASGEPNPPRLLLTGRRPVVQASMDNKHLFLRDANAAPEELSKSSAAREREWVIVNVESLAEMGRVPFIPGTGAMQVVEDRVYFLAAGPITGPLNQPNVRPQTLCAYDLGTKKMAWKHPVAGKAIHPPGQ